MKPIKCCGSIRKGCRTVITSLFLQPFSPQNCGLISIREARKLVSSHLDSKQKSSSTKQFHMECELKQVCALTKT